MKIQNCELKKLLPAFMKEQKDVAALAGSLDPLIRQIGALLPLCSDFEAMDSLPEEVLDLLAKELSIDWYKKNEPLDVKRSVVKSSDAIHMILGTVEAVLQVVSDFYGGATIEEWFDYGGEPGHFKIHADNESGGIVFPEELNALVDSVKRAGAILDTVEFIWSTYETIYFVLTSKSLVTLPTLHVEGSLWLGETIYVGAGTTSKLTPPSSTIESPVWTTGTFHSGTGSLSALRPENLKVID